MRPPFLCASITGNLIRGPVNIVFFILVGAAFLVAGWRQFALPSGVTPGPMDAARNSAAERRPGGGQRSAIGLIGAMALFQGLLKVAEAAGLLTALARLLRPILLRLFPQIPADHPAMGAMVMNIAANMLGLSNAATPFGVRAMKELDRLNPTRGTASDAMVLFLAINTANVTILPTHVMALRAAAGSHDPAAVIATTLFATLFSTGAPQFSSSNWGAGWFPEVQARNKSYLRRPRHPGFADGDDPVPFSLSRALIPLALLWGRQASPWIIPLCTCSLRSSATGLARRVPIYSVFVSGAKEGLWITPFASFPISSRSWPQSGCCVPAARWIY